MQRDFVDNTSHELKSPLTSIVGFAEMLEDGDDLPELIGQQVTREYPGTTLHSVFVGEENGAYAYIAVFDDVAQDYFYRAWFNAGSGLLMRSVMTVAPPAQDGQVVLKPAEAAAVAVAQVPDGHLYDIRYEQVGPCFLYLIGVIGGGQEMTVTVHAQNGAVLGLVSQATTLAWPPAPPSPPPKRPRRASNRAPPIPPLRRGPRATQKRGSQRLSRATMQAPAARCQGVSSSVSSFSHRVRLRWHLFRYTSLKVSA